MNLIKNSMNALILGITFLISVIFLGTNYFNYKSLDTGITVTGSATKNFSSDLIVWRGYFSKKAQTSKEAYKLLKDDASKINEYLLSNGVKEEEIVFSSVSIRENYVTDQVYDEASGEYRYFERFDGYLLSQDVVIESGEVDKIEVISRDITQLIDSGVEFFSSSPEYYYTKLSELKLQMITEATDNARERAEILARNSNSSLGRLVKGNLGVFQITAQNSSEDEYDYMGVFNTSSKNKTALVTVKLQYKTK